MQRNTEADKESSYLENLPEEVILNALHFCDKRDLLRLATASKKINQISNDDKLWLDEVITAPLVKKMNMSAKDLNRYRKLFADGNFSQAIDESTFKDTLQRLAKQCAELDFGVTVMPGLANNLSIGYPKLSYQTTRGLPRRMTNVIGFFNNMSDEDKKQVNSPKLNPAYLIDYTHAKLRGTSISTYNGSKEHNKAVQAIKNNPCAIIFSNDREELEKLLNLVCELSKEAELTSVPLIFVVTYDLEMLLHKGQFATPIVGFIEQSDGKPDFLSAVSAYSEVLKRMNKIKENLPLEQPSLMSSITNFIRGK